ncbi:hypothetical protein [Pseudoduganella sp. R-34]|uniref:hypothetical protein n=1 Tax=Pseudoduganella sp. R-34 TaxID=3404062 RepID=UPI003CEC4502
MLPTLIIATGSFLYYFINVFKERRVLQYPSYAEAVFEVFGFPNPRSINLLKVAIGFRNTGWRHAWQADLLMPEVDEKSELKPSGTANRHLGR